jgi:5'-AMP-activated protein kinase regulatory beta subunit
MWKERIPMTKNGNEFTLIMPIERNIHTYKFVVNNEWRFASDQPTMRDEHGNINNFIDTTHYAPQSTQPAFDHPPK